MALRTGDLLIELFKQSPKWKELNDEDLSRLKRVLVSISKDYIDVCEKYGLRYFMGSGTAIGSIRHKGFIPWDDDMDFYMAREDYNKFLKIADKELGEKYFIRSISKGDRVTYPTIHICKKNSVYINYGDLVSSEDEPDEVKGFYIDIFPYDNESSIKIIHDIKGLFCMFVDFLISCINLHKSILYLKKVNVKISRNDMNAMRFKDIIGIVCGIVPLFYWVKFYNWFISRNKNNKSKYMTCFMGRYLDRFTHLRSDLFGERRLGEFEGYMWDLPTEVEKILRKEYNGDVMIPPPLGHRKVHPVFELKFPDDIK